MVPPEAVKANLPQGTQGDAEEYPDKVETAISLKAVGVLRRDAKFR